MRSAIPRATSGISKGRIITPWIALFIPAVDRIATTALAVPSIAETIDVITATSMLMRKDAAITRSSNSVRYQSKVNPVHCAVEGLALNEYRITLKTGKYKITK